MKNIHFIFASILAVSTSFSVAEENTANATLQPIDKLVSELAEKPSQHAAVAKYYREKATEAKNEAENHRKLKQIYSSGRLHQQNSNWMASHCENLINAFETEAKEYEQMASEHEKLAH